jgi:hypothetical protein
MKRTCSRCELEYEAAGYQSFYCPDCVTLNTLERNKVYHRYNRDPDKDLEKPKRKPKPKPIMTDAEQKVIDAAVRAKLNMQIDQGRRLEGEEFIRVAKLYGGYHETIHSSVQP